MRQLSTKGAAVASIVCLLAIPSAFAAKDNTNYLNGKPFSQMNEAIEANRSNIEAIEISVSSLNSAMDSVIGDITALELRVANNSNDIEALFANDTILGAELDALQAQHEQDVAIINDEIALVEDRIDTLRSDMDAAITEAKAETAALKVQHDADVSSLLADITALLVEIADMRNTLDAYSAQLDQLTVNSEQLSEQVDGLQLRADALTGRIDALEGYHTPLAQQCDQGADAYTSSPWVVCEANENEAWISAHNSGTYHPEQICQDLGYRTIGSWGGTCGNVCGYCQAHTSCSSHGDKVLNREWDDVGNAGADEFGGRIRSTVSWSCVK